MEIKQKLKQIFRCCFYRDYRFLLRNDPPFDTEYFCQLAKLNLESLADPLWSYIEKERETRVNLNFKEDEWRQLPSPNALFDIFYYLAKYFPNGFKGNAFAHYLKEGWRSGFWPGPYFDPETYRKNSHWNEGHGNPLSHYTYEGARKTVSPSQFFDIGFYLDKTAFLHRYKKSIIRHHKIYEAKNCKSTTPIFDPLYYLNKQTSKIYAEADPFSHFLTTAQRNIVRPNEWFDPEYYASQIPDLTSMEEILSHYLTKGVFQRRFTDSRVEKLRQKPLFSVVVPVYNPAPNILNCCIRSVLYQTYPNWELCLADDCSTEPQVRDLMNYWAKADDRIKLTFHEENRGISETTNSAAKLADGEYIGFLDNDDELAPDCLYHIVKEIIGSKARVLYTDEDLIGDDSSRLSVFYKPDFNQHLLFSHNYVTHFLAVDKALFDEVGGFRTECDGAQDYDLILRLSEKTQQISHISRVLYHWRAVDTSTSINHSRKLYAHEAGKNALQTTLKVRGFETDIEDTEFNFFYHPRYRRRGEPQVSVIVGTSTANADISPSESSFENNKYENCQFIRSGYHETADQGIERVNRSELFHKQIVSSTGEYFVLIREEPVNFSSNWVEELMAPLQQQDEIGLACGRVVRQSVNEQSFLLPDLTNNSATYLADFLTSCTKHLNGLHCPQLVSVCNEEFCMIGRKLYEQLGGFDYELFPDRFAMLDLALRAGEAGYKIFYSPFALLTVDSKNGMNQGEREKRADPEKKAFQHRWGSVLERLDPYYSPGILNENGIDEAQFREWKRGVNK